LDVFEAIKTRKSIRKYKSEPIPVEKLELIFEAARLAPSAGNRQPWRFVVVQDAERKKALATVANNQMFLSDAAVIVAAIGNPETSKRWYDKDIMIAVEHMVLAAAELGYGTCWIGAFDEEKVKNLLEIPKRMRVIALLPIGIPDVVPPSKPRKELSEIFFKEKYGKPLNMK
jgi:nitroreductase